MPRPTRPSPRPRAIRLPPPEPAGLAHAHLAPLVSDGAVPSLAWAVVRDGDKAVGGFGGAGPETSFQIGSVTKVFTALVLADMAERGEVHLSDPAARYLPGGVTAGPTLADLATHTAGAGGLYSTAADLARFLYACLLAVLAAPGTPAAPDTALEALGPAIRATLTSRRPIPGGQIGLAWHLARRGDHTIAWHNGMTGGFSAMIALDPARRLGVAAFANSAGSPPSPLDQAVLSAFGS
ncbi:MAG TPA: serine hydrolase domain-containing protein [Streptosporangiaceae bacterium]